MRRCAARETTVGDIVVHDYEPETATMRRDVLQGLARVPKCLPSRYLYDQRGSRLFDLICQTEEYYLTRTELAILRRHTIAIARRIGPQALIIEPGSGSGVKTRLLLDALECPAGYVPIDVARQTLADAASRIARQFAQLHVVPVCADFTSMYDVPPIQGEVGKRVVYFPGSTIGNFAADEAIRLLGHMADLCKDDGAVLIGVDLKKDPAILEPAYDDAQGVSREFALNYLVRLNRELDADFRLKCFGYEAPYNEEQGRIEMALVSRCSQTVRIEDSRIAIGSGERVYTEFSYKYDLSEFAALAAACGLQVEDVWADSNRFFGVFYLSPAS
jgi:dimethylhistidine N-methyltransferase